MIWRPVRLGWGTLIEVERDWSLDDCLDAGLIANAFEDAQHGS